MQKSLLSYMTFLVTSIMTSITAMESNQSTHQQWWMKPSQPDFIYEIIWENQIARRITSYTNNEQINALYLVPKNKQDNPILGEISLFNFNDPTKFLKARRLAQSIFQSLRDYGFNRVAVGFLILQKLVKLRLCSPDQKEKIDKSSIIILSLPGENQFYAQISCIINVTNNLPSVVKNH